LLLKALSEDTGEPAKPAIRAAGVDIFEARAKEAVALGRAPRAWPPQSTAYPHWHDDYAKAAASAHIDIPLEEAVATLNAWINEIDHAGPC
ncbi:MAG: hypothetical protein FWF43_05195, partial [Propionibacteriaceae bacterium]|nr:hypothetical protein [Propionibacteriaceae bacterium]